MSDKITDADHVIASWHETIRQVEADKGGFVEIPRKQIATTEAAQASEPMTDEQLKAKAREIAADAFWFPTWADAETKDAVRRKYLSGDKDDEHSVKSAYLGLLEGRRMMKEEADAKLQVLLLGLPTNGLKAEGISEAAEAIRSIIP